MKAKTIITTVLLLFVAGSLAYLVVNEVRSRSHPSPVKMQLPAVAESNELSSQAKTSKVVFYYFYGNVRCPTCRKFEAFSKEALQEKFAEALNTGRLEWQAVNVEQPGSEHFISDYQLHTKSIVIVKIKNGKQVNWKNLNRIWQLVRNKNAFVRYIQDEVRSFLGADE